MIFTISGASALIYQVIWARWLGLVFGNTTLSISVVLGSFMAGLALGSWLAGRFLHRIDNPMLYYAFMELGIGSFAVCFPLIAKFADILFTALVSSESSTAYSIFIKAVLSAAVLLVPTTLMGATLPLLTDFFHRSPKHTGNWRVGILYAANTLGAAIGIAVASFILIELIGVTATTFAAAALNFLVAGLAYKFSRSVTLLSNKLPTSEKRKFDNPARFAITLITLSGALALASEVLWTRTLETIIGNSTYAFATIVLLYLFGIAAGSWIMSLVVNRLKSLPVWLAAIQLGMGIWTVISIRLFELIINSIANYTAVVVPLSTIFSHYFKAVSVLFPLSLFSGACFPLATRIIDPKSEDAKGVLVAKAYAWNTVGALIGSLAAGFMIAPLWDYFNSLYILAIFYCLAAVAAYTVIGASKWQIPYRVQISVLLGALSVAFAFFSFVKAGDKNNYVRRFEAKHPSFRMVFHKAGMQGVTSVIKHRFIPRQDMLLVNGMGMTVKVTDTKMMAHLPLLLHPHPENTLVICLGMGTTYRAAISHGKKATVVELVKEVVDAFDYFYEEAPALKAYRYGKILVNDGRNFLKVTREKFDVITIDPPPPIDAAGVNNLYSKEFIELARKHLNKGGIMAHWMPFPGTGSGVDDFETHNMLVKTFSQVFPYTYAHRSFNGIGMHIIGSSEPINISAEAITAKLSSKAVYNDITEWEQVPFEFFVEGWVPLTPEYLARSGIPSITDNEPHLEFFLLRTVKSKGKKMHPVNFW
ncbi:MAG: fused MFS/spermidine synthase [Nitrospirae bacterium]|nr:fused MFS/spermidine synthase [Nitrospirota bacterium]